jgi:RNA polymerase sigma factor (sigma-70 family)
VNHLLRRAYDVLGNREDAEDAVQTAWVLALEEGHVEPTSQFLERAISIVRRNAMSTYGTPEDFPDTNPLFQEEGKLEGMIWEEIIKLPIRQRLVFVLRHEGYSHREIGRILGISDLTSRSLLRRARINVQKGIRRHKGQEC